MIRRLPIALALVACLSLLVAGAASAMTHSSTRGIRIHYLHPESVRLHKASGPRPTITRVSPMQVKVGQKVVIYGKNFRAGAGKDKVFFLRSGGGVVIVKAKIATTTRLVVKVPSSVTTLLDVKSGSVVATKLRLRVLTDRFGNTTKLSKSPLILPASGKTSGGTTTPACQKATTDDSDGDGLSNTLEINKLHTDPCKADTDGDGVPDGYEYQSALDLNNTTLTGRDSQNALPCPCKVPYPNPLDPTDLNTDHDGDGLPMWLEYKLNKYVHGPKVGTLQYSDGKQRSQDVTAPADPVFAYMDLNKLPSLQGGYLSDDERDADKDGLTNWDECCGRMTQEWWDKEYSGSNGGLPKETRYPLTFPGVDPTNPDTDGDGVPDGLDDQDHDGLSNRFEVSRPWDWLVTYESGKHSGVVPDQDKVSNGGLIPDAVVPNPWARVQPFNPCKPVDSKTCWLHPDFGYYENNEDWVGLDPETLGAAPSAPWLFDSNDYPLANGE